jgi:hypothetical protein
MGKLNVVNVILSEAACPECSEGKNPVARMRRFAFYTHLDSSARAVLLRAFLRITCRRLYFYEA